MADYWIDPAAGGSNNGTSPANAWTSPAKLVDVPDEGDTVWVRRTVNHEVTSAMSFSTAGTYGNHKKAIGWPRNSFSGTGNFTNGSTSITNVTSPAVSWRRYGGRWIKNDSDGKWYLVTKAIDGGTTLLIDRPYRGGNAAGAAFTVKEDEDHAFRPQAGIDAGWDSDAQDLPRYYGNPTAHMWAFTSAARHWLFRNFYLNKTGSAAYSLIHQSAPSGGMGLLGFVGCVLNSGEENYASLNAITLAAPGWISMRRGILRGTYMSGHNGIYCPSRLTLRDFSIQNFYHPINCQNGCVIDLENVNIGPDGEYSYNDFYVPNSTTSVLIVGKDVWSSAEAVVTRAGFGTPANAAMGVGNLQSVSIENWQKNLAQIWRNDGLNIFSLRVNDSTTDPRKRSGGGDLVIKVDLGSMSDWGPPIEIHPGSVFDQRIWQYSGTAKAYRVYLQSLVAVASGLVTLEAAYIDSHSSDTQWTEASVIGTASISARSGNTDWSQYIEVTGITVAVDSPVRLRLRVRVGGSSGNYLYVDPRVWVY